VHSAALHPMFVVFVNVSWLLLSILPCAMSMNVVAVFTVQFMLKVRFVAVRTASVGSAHVMLLFVGL